MKKESKLNTKEDNNEGTEEQKRYHTQRTNSKMAEVLPYQQLF